MINKNGDWLVYMDTSDKKKITLHFQNLQGRKMRFHIQKFENAGATLYQLEKFKSYHQSYPTFSDVPSLIEYYEASFG